MTTYKEPRIEIEQQITAAASNTYLPDLRGCIVAPFYDIVEEESVGTYVNAEEEYAWASVRPVDVRTGTNADEITYPLTVVLKDALTEVTSNEAGGSIDGATDPFTILDSSNPFTFPAVAGADVFIKFDSATGYTHDCGSVAVTNDGVFATCTVAGTIAIPGVIPFAIAQGVGVTGNVTAVYATTNGSPLTTGNFPSTCYLKITETEGSFGAGALDAPYADITIASIGARFTATSTSPVFYTGLDYDSVATASISVQIGVGIYESGTIYRLNDAYSVEYLGVALVGTTITTVITRAALTTAEIAAMRQVRSVTSAGAAKLYIAKTGVSYAGLVYDIFEKADYSITIDDFSDWDITLTATGVILPLEMETPDGLPVTSADVYLTYRALRTDLENELDYYENTDAVTTEFTTVNKYNTGAYMLYLALTQSQGRQVYATGLGTDFYTDVAAAFTSALSYLEDKRVYAVACASMLPAVHTAVNAHTALCSTAEQGAWRIGINSHTMSEYELLHASQLTGAGYVDVYREGFTGNRFVDAAALFLFDGVSAGDCVYITGWTGITPVELESTIPVAGVVACSDWKTADTTITIAGVTLPTGFTISEFRNKTVKFSYGVATYDTSTDAGVYSDHTRSNVKISTAQTYGTLGYKVISASITLTGDLTLHLYTVDAAPTTATTPDSQTCSLIQVYDGPLSLRDETAILNNYIEIGSVVSEDMLLATFKSGYTGVYTGVTYQTRDHYDRDELATVYAAYTSAFDTRRMNFTFPHVYQDSDGTQLPGYFISAGEAGWIGGAWPHQSITSQNLQGYYRLLYSNKYFKKSQLNIIAGGGVTIYTQEVDDAGITCRHQLTTDMASILTQENSVTRSVDTGSYMLLDALNPLKGRYNIVDDLYTVINTKVNAIRLLLCENKYSRYGSILKKFEVIQLIQDPTAADGLYIEIECETQKPFNRARVLIKVS